MNSKTVHHSIQNRTHSKASKENHGVQRHRQNKVEGGISDPSFIGDHNPSSCCWVTFHLFGFKFKLFVFSQFYKYQFNMFVSVFQQSIYVDLTYICSLFGRQDLSYITFWVFFPDLYHLSFQLVLLTILCPKWIPKTTRRVPGSRQLYTV